MPASTETPAPSRQTISRPRAEAWMISWTASIWAFEDMKPPPRAVPRPALPDLTDQRIIFQVELRRYPGLHERAAPLSLGRERGAGEVRRPYGRVTVSPGSGGVLAG